LRYAAAVLASLQGELPPDLDSWRVFVLASLGAAPARSLNDLWNRRGELSPQGLALLGMALRTARDRRSGAAASELAAKASRDPAGGVYWTSNRDLMFYDFESEGSIEATAFALRFLLLEQPGSELIDSAAQWLVAHRDQGSYWTSTKRTAFVLYALIDYLRLNRELDPSFSATVTLNGRRVFSRSFGRADVSAPPAVIRIPAAELSGSDRVEIRRSGSGRLYASVRWDYRADPTGMEPASADGLSVTREFFRLAPATENGRIVYDLRPLAGALRPGETIAVRLRVAGRRHHRSLIVEDPIPAGAETVPRDDFYEIRGRPDWWSSWYERRELRDSRVLYFPDSLPQGSEEFVYLMKIINPGVFRLSPARAELMYTPGVMAHTESRTLEVVKQP
jgi:uncharacterized protein YfaS (alpha-2-macroglobulin family)